MKIVINKCYGGFGVGDAVFLYLISEKGWKVTKYNRKGGYENPKADICKHYGQSHGNYVFVNDIHEEDSISFRSNPDVVEAVEKLGDAANGFCAKLKVVEIPDGVECTIEQYDGVEWVAEKHRTWG